MAELPSGTVTFLFTDLEGSTRLWEDHPEAMHGALARHDEILRAAIAVHDGHVVKTTGDGVHAAFAEAPAAVLAARDAQLALAAEPWAATGPLKVRMGVHTGHAEARDGDYYGSSVNRAARLMSAANGGQVVVSLTTEELVRDELSDGVALRDLGEQRLRDLSRPEHTYQLVAPGLEEAFASLRSLDAYPSNLPQQVTSFVGRQREQAEIAQALESSRVVTVTGVGGVGKTRLATQVAADVLP
ncbi:MAG TPA: adenylate/guanylate cyclase domain-containing protein, partial [Acidimicrobiia bacterium]|nr:adenylate/guanylate cyclase domain-containing protein [Acidimicrobiia bacterium]